MYHVESWDELKQAIKELKSELSNPNEIWFRGQGNAQYTLLPSLFRAPQNVDKEESIFRLYKQISQSYHLIECRTGKRFLICSITMRPRGLLIGRKI